MYSKKQIFMQTAKKNLEPSKHAEFECPLCGGIATVYRRNDIVAECHACCIKVGENG